MTQTYLDNAATTKVDEKVLKTMIPYFSEKYGNPSSLHFAGEESRREIEESRETIARSIGASHSEIIFTGSGTEANNFALKGLFWHNKKNNTGKNHIITTKIEHDCVLNTCKWLKTQGAEVTYLDVDSEGFVDLKQLENSITEKTFVVSIIHGNNEIGTIQDLEKISKICKEKNVLFHTDACQSFTKASINVKKQNIDLMTINAHKIHGPKGVGALYLNKPIKNQIIPLLHGGGQEFQLRSSTENVAGILGFAKAVKIASNRDVRNMIKLRDYFMKELLEIPNTELNGTKQNRLCNNINLSFKNIEGEAIGSYLNAKQIFVSTGSACSSKSLDPSHVIMALGKSEVEANSAIRLSISKYTTRKEVDFALNEIKKTVEKLRKMSPLVK